MIPSHLIASIAIFHILAFLCHVDSADYVQVTIPKLGSLLGTLDKSLWSRRPIYEFRAIPYAKSPNGPRRFKKPEPAPKWAGVLNATEFGRECPQAFTHEELSQLFIRVKTENVEDCLHLNVFTPMKPGSCSRLLPVMYYIHGGSFRVGSAKTFRATHLLEYDVVLVTVQYRLGPLGFLSLQNDDISGNMGLLDQILGLRWVQRYIEGFCGDKNRVTVFGQSAGGAAVSIMLVSPQAKGLFHQGIIQSGSALCQWAVNENPEHYARSISVLVGCGNGTKKEVSDCLSKVTPYKLVEAQSSLVMETMMEETRSGGLRASDVSGSHAVIQAPKRKKHLEEEQKHEEEEDRVLTEDPRVSFDSGYFLKVPLMVGVTKHEGTFIVGDIYDFYDRNISFSGTEHHTPDLLKIVLTYAGIDDVSDAVRDVFEKYFFTDNQMGNFAKMIPGLADICGSLLLKACTFKIARLTRKYSPTYVYSFNYKGKYTKFGYGRDMNYTFPGGVAHSDELLYLFPTDDEPLEGEDKKMAKTMAQLWTNFAINGIPSPTDSIIEWPKMSTPYGPYLIIDRIPNVKSDFTKEYTITVREGIPPDPGEEGGGNQASQFGGYHSSSSYITYSTVQYFLIIIVMYYNMFFLLC